MAVSGRNGVHFSLAKWVTIVCILLYLGGAVVPDPRPVSPAQAPPLRGGAPAGEGLATLEIVRR